MPWFVPVARQVRRWSRRLLGRWGRCALLGEVEPSELLDALDAPDRTKAIEVLFGWPRDAAYTLAKGLAATAAGIVTTIVAATFAKQPPKVSGLIVVLAATGVLLALVLAAMAIAAAYRIHRQYVDALAISDQGEPT